MRIQNAGVTNARGRFAIFCVELDLSLPLVPTVCLAGVPTAVEYEGLHQICFECGQYGHRAEGCVTHARTAATTSSTLPHDVAPSLQDDVDDVVRGPYGPWMMPTYRQRRWPVASASSGKAVGHAPRSPPPSSPGRTRLETTSAAPTFSQPECSDGDNAGKPARRSVGTTDVESMPYTTRFAALQEVQEDFSDLLAEIQLLKAQIKSVDGPSATAHKGKAPGPDPVVTLGQQNSKKAHGKNKGRKGGSPAATLPRSSPTGPLADPASSARRPQSLTGHPPLPLVHKGTAPLPSFAESSTPSVCSRYSSVR